MRFTRSSVNDLVDNANIQRLQKRKPVDLSRDSFIAYTTGQLTRRTDQSAILPMPSYSSLRELAIQDSTGSQSDLPPANLTLDTDQFLMAIADEFHDKSGLMFPPEKARALGFTDALLEPSFQDELKRKVFQNHLRTFVAKKLKHALQNNELTQDRSIATAIRDFQQSKHGFAITPDQVQRWELSDQKLDSIFRERFEQGKQQIKEDRATLVANVAKHITMFEDFYAIERTDFPNLTFKDFSRQRVHRISLESFLDHLNAKTSPFKVTVEYAKQLGLTQDFLDDKICELKVDFKEKMKFYKRRALQSASRNVST